MATVLKTLVLLTVLIGLGVFGFWLGHTARDSAGLESPLALVKAPDIELGDYLPPAPVPPAETNTAPYAASPHVAPLARTVWTDDLTQQDGTIIATLPAEQAASVRIGSEVIFYARRPFQMLTGVSYVDAIDVDGQSAAVRFSAPDNLAMPLKRLRARIIAMETVGTKQLPLSALHYDDAGRPFVWKLERVGTPPDDPSQRGGEYAALYLPVFAGVKGDDAFEVGPEIDMGDIVLANAPADIENGQVVPISVFAEKKDDTPLAEQARDIQRAANTRALKREIQLFEMATGGAEANSQEPAAGGGGCSAAMDNQGLPAGLATSAQTLPEAGPSGASAGCASCTAPAAPAAPTPAPPAPPSGGCSGCTNSTY